MRNVFAISMAVAGALFAASSEPRAASGVQFTDGESGLKRPVFALADGESGLKRPVLTLTDGESGLKRPVLKFADGVTLIGFADGESDLKRPVLPTVNPA
jgi:hypothetical protein